MISVKRLRSVIHSTAHHAVSGLCYVHPHLGAACKSLGLTSVSVDLISSKVDLVPNEITREIKLSTGALRDKFGELLSAEGIEISEITNASLEFQFALGRWPSSCYIYARTKEGKEVEVAVDNMGKKAEILDGHT